MEKLWTNALKLLIYATENTIVSCMYIAVPGEPAHGQ